MLIEPEARSLYDCQPAIFSNVFQPLARVMDRDELLAKIKEARISAGISQREAAEKAGIAQPTWAQLETREKTQKSVSAETLIRMGAAVGLSVAYDPESFTVRSASGKKSSRSK